MGYSLWGHKELDMTEWLRTYRLEVSDQGVALGLCRKEFPQRWKVVKQVKYLLEGKRAKYMWRDTRGGLLRVSLSQALVAV